MSALDDMTEDMDIDDVEEMFYSYGTDYIAEDFGIELEDEEEEEE